MRDTPNEYERRAAEAEAAARRAKSEEERLAHLEVAQVWRDLAERRREKDGGSR